MGDTEKEHDTSVTCEEGVLSHEVASEGVLTGTLDPIYEAKAHVLNNAVSSHGSIIMARTASSNMSIDPRYWYGMVSVAVVRGCWFRVRIRQPLASRYVFNIHSDRQ